MFSLIITIISIALVAAIAVATLYYGGSTMSQGTVKAQAAQYVTEGQQIEGAVTLFYSDNIRYPTDLNELVLDGYLNTIPDGVFAQVGESSSIALAGSAGWLTPTPGQPTYELSTPVTDAVCEAVNNAALGTTGIPGQAYSGYATQCYYSPTTSLDTVVVTLTSNGVGTGLANALPPIDVAPPAAIPPWAGGPATGWQVPPAVPGTGSGSTSSSATPVQSGQLVWSMPAVTMPSLSVGVAATPVTVTLFNPTNQPVYTAPSSANLTLATFTTTCASSLAPGQFCNVTVSFNTSQAGTISGTVTYGPDASAMNNVLTISGAVASGSAGSYTVSATNMGMLGQCYGQTTDCPGNSTSLAITSAITITNTGSVSLEITDAAIPATYSWGPMLADQSETWSPVVSDCLTSVIASIGNSLENYLSPKAFALMAYSNPKATSLSNAGDGPYYLAAGTSCHVYAVATPVEGLGDSPLVEAAGTAINTTITVTANAVATPSTPIVVSAPITLTLGAQPN